jgi:hypothetical protein
VTLTCSRPASGKGECHATKTYSVAERHVGTARKSIDIVPAPCVHTNVETVVDYGPIRVSLCVSA